MDNPSEDDQAGLWTELDGLAVDIRLLIEQDIASGNSSIDQVIDDAGHFLIQAHGKWFQFEIEEAVPDHYLKPKE